MFAVVILMAVTVGFRNQIFFYFLGKNENLFAVFVYSTNYLFHCKFAKQM